MDHTAVTAILFDLDNTLIETSRANGIAIQKTSQLLRTSLCLDDDTIGRICDKFNERLLHEVFDTTAGRTIDDVRVGHWHESILEIVGTGSMTSLAEKCYFLWKNSRLELLSFTPEISNLLKELRTSYKLLLLTNGEAKTQREKVLAVGCETYFNAIVVGGEHPEEKPSLSIFRHCFSVLGVEAKDCIMVGDSLNTDIQGGVNAGVRATVWINNKGASPRNCSLKPDYVIASVLELPGILANYQ